MSTKIYNAHRIRKDRIESITKYMRDMQKEVYKFVSNNESLLAEVHATAYVWAKRHEHSLYKEKLDEGLFVHPINTFLQESENASMTEPWLLSVKLSSSIAEDDRFWYIKFFINEQWQRDIYKKLINDRPFLRDYHYQNQTDSPDGISQAKYDQRGSVWDAVLMDRHDYKGVLQYTLFDADEFQKMIFREGEKLPYNFKKEEK